ncbi:MAG: hypothetical protein LH609_13090 [Rudanella sp.]|nr:hypothetical protein [Rudanella sp.]
MIRLFRRLFVNQPSPTHPSMDETICSIHCQWLTVWGRELFMTGDCMQSEIFDPHLRMQGEHWGSDWLDRPFTLVPQAGVAPVFGSWVDQVFTFWQYYMRWNITEVMKEMGLFLQAIPDFDTSNALSVAGLMLSEQASLTELLSLAEAVMPCRIHQIERLRLLCC